MAILRRKVERAKKIEQASSADEVLLEEIREYKVCEPLIVYELYHKSYLVLLQKLLLDFVAINEHYEHFQIYYYVSCMQNIIGTLDLTHSQMIYTWS